MVGPMPRGPPLDPRPRATPGIRPAKNEKENDNRCRPRAHTGERCSANDGDRQEETGILGSDFIVTAAVREREAKPFGEPRGRRPTAPGRQQAEQHGDRQDPRLKAASHDRSPLPLPTPHLATLLTPPFW